jgi:hypothetical protein
MRSDSIRAHLKPYSISQKRATTLNHAFASALAPCDPYEPDRISEALRALGQEPAALTCVYCHGAAETWDHLEGLVRDKSFSGYGHTVQNLVPACRHCNSRKGNRPWREFLASCCPPEERERRVGAIEAHCSRGATAEATLAALSAVPPELNARFVAIRAQMSALMEEADRVAAEIRRHVHERARDNG